MQTIRIFTHRNVRDHYYCLRRTSFLFFASLFRLFFFVSLCAARLILGSLRPSKFPFFSSREYPVPRLFFCMHAYVTDRLASFLFTLVT